MLNGDAKILVTSRSGSGSWAIRGVQLGGAIGATVERNASKVKGYDLAVLVKRQKPDLLHRLHSVGVPIVWDVVDAWPQPEGGSWGRETCLQWLRDEVATIRPVGIVAATQAMAEDCAEFGIPVIALPHHARPSQPRNPIRLRVQTIGYEGAERYLGHWYDVLNAECAMRRWRFLVNPAHLSDLDIVVAFRSHKGYAAQHWKSNVKLANAQGSGTPCVLNCERGYMETHQGGALWANTPEELSTALDTLTDVHARRKAADALHASEITLTMVADSYKTWLHQLKF
jgi:hypothetical protein